MKLSQALLVLQSMKKEIFRAKRKAADNGCLQAAI